MLKAAIKLITKEDFLSFIEDNKRPWGNKCTTASIVFNIGWDVQWVMRYHEMPKWVKYEATHLYALVINEVKSKMKQEEFEKNSVWRL